jgi:hypothetical protein
MRRRDISVFQGGMMKKLFILTALCAGIMIGIASQAETNYGAAIVGTWKFDLGGGFMATVEYKSDGTLVQKVGDMVMQGTYTVTGNKMKTVVKNQTTMFTFISLAGNKLTIKRDTDGKTIVYTKQ